MLCASTPSLFWDGNAPLCPRFHEGVDWHHRWFSDIMLVLGLFLCHSGILSWPSRWRMASLDLSCVHLGMVLMPWFWMTSNLCRWVLESEEAKAVINYRQNGGLIQYEQDPLRHICIGHDFMGFRDNTWDVVLARQRSVKNNLKVISDCYLFWRFCQLFSNLAFVLLQLCCWGNTRVHLFYLGGVDHCSHHTICRICPVPPANRLLSSSGLCHGGMTVHHPQSLRSLPALLIGWKWCRQCKCLRVKIRGLSPEVALVLSLLPQGSITLCIWLPFSSQLPNQFRLSGQG